MTSIVNNSEKLMKVKLCKKKTKTKKKKCILFNLNLKLILPVAICEND